MRPRHRAPTLLVKPSSDAGISGEHVQQVLEWADELGMGRNGLEATSNGA